MSNIPKVRRRLPTGALGLRRGVSRRDPLVRDTKQRILDAAVEVFGERGYRGASVDDVALAAGVTKGAVYYYFTDKDDLARDLQHALWGQLAQDALAVYDPERPAVDNLLECFEAFLATIQSMAGARTFLREAWFTAALDSAGRADHEDALGLVQGLLQTAMERRRTGSTGSRSPHQSPGRRTDGSDASHPRFGGDRAHHGRHRAPGAVARGRAGTIGSVVKIAGAVAVITGASRGIGRATARALHGHGATVGLIARSRASWTSWPMSSGPERGSPRPMSPTVTRSRRPSRT